MILKDMNFTDFYNRVREIFSKHFSEDEVSTLMEYVDILSDANFRCYKANMIVIEERKKEAVNSKLIEEMEWVARSVGEYRVSSKAKINLFISRTKTIKEKTDPKALTNDDIVYSVGEMMDRLSIETIKREDFRVNKRPAHMTESSQKLSDRVEKYLKEKLQEVDNKGFYECVHEQRTYDLEGIVKDLAI